MRVELQINTPSACKTAEIKRSNYQEEAIPHYVTETLEINRIRLRENAVNAKFINILYIKQICWHIWPSDRSSIKDFFEVNAKNIQSNSPFIAQSKP